jgi:tRNA 2-thiocytidine biosynthesis protein TtcA
VSPPALLAIAPPRATAAPADVERRVLDLMGRAMGRYRMLCPGDRVAVGVSGGKDSLCLLDALVAYRRRAPFPYEVVALTIEQGKFKTPVAALRAQVERLGVPWVLREDPATLRLVAGGVAHGCDVCSRHRRTALYRLAQEQGCQVLALGHTADDAAEALLRGILFNGRVAGLRPAARSRKGTMRLVRPLVEVPERLTRAYAEARGYTPIGCVCGDKDGVRREIRGILEDLARRHPQVPASLQAAAAALALGQAVGEDTGSEPGRARPTGEPA